MDMTLRITPNEAAAKVIHEIVNGSFSGELVDQHRVFSPQGECVVLVLEKYFMRNSSRASLTVTIDNLSGETNVHAVGSGGGQGTFFRFDWGSAGSLENNVREALQEYSVCSGGE